MKPINIKITLVAFSIFLFFAREVKSQSIGIIDSSALKELRLNPKPALSDEVEADDALGSIEYIPLETTKESQFGRVDQFEIVDDNFIILDRAAAIVNSKSIPAIIIFNKQGQFRARINCNNASKFAVDNRSKEIIIIEANMLSSYDLTGKLIKTVKFPFTFEASSYLPNGLIAFYRGYHPQPFGVNYFFKNKQSSFSNLVIANSSFDIQKLYLPFDTTGIGRFEVLAGNNHNFTNSGKIEFFHLPGKYEFYEIGNENIIKSYRVVLPLENTIPTDFITSKSYKGNKARYTFENPYVIFDLEEFYQAGDVIAFTAFARRLNNSFTYNLKTKILTSLSAVKTDQQKVLSRLDNEIIGCDGTLMYTWLKASAFMPVNRPGPKKSYAKAPLRLQELSKNGKPDNNPVIIRFKPI